jgi:pimeloyl-ACP methyl ester carboxylesterase
MKKRYIDLAYGQIHARLVEGTGVPIIYFHQTASSSAMWEKVMTLLPDRAQWAFDTPGFGQSSAPTSTPTMDDYAHYMLEALNCLGIQNVHLVGHHTGAGIALALAHLLPDRAASLSLIGLNMLNPSERTAFASKLGAPFRPGKSGAYLLKNWEYLRVGGADADIGLLHREMIDMLGAWQSRPHAYAAAWAQDFAGLFQTVGAPVLIMSAPDDILFPYFDRAMEARPDARVVALSGGANFAPDLVPGEIAGALVGFVSSVEGKA